VLLPPRHPHSLEAPRRSLTPTRRQEPPIKIG
jgi:hypothetical protein